MIRECKENNLNYPLQVEDGCHLCEASKLVSDGPGGDSGEIRHKRTKFFIKLQPSKLQQKDQTQLKYAEMKLVDTEI